MDSSKQKTMCVKCAGKICYPFAGVNDPLPSVEEAPDYCPMRRFPEVLKKAEAEYDRPDVKEFARLASVQEAECYEMTAEGIHTRLPRIEETMAFAGKCNYKKLGIAFCIGLKEEAGIISRLFSAKGFDVVSVNCKVGRVPKENIGIKGDEKITGPDLMEPICNPIGQAEILNRESVDLAMMVGLCVGHDTLFLKYCKAPCTVLAVKDRVLGHNPLGAVYLSKGPYYSRLNTPVDKTGSGKKVELK